MFKMKERPPAQPEPLTWPRIIPFCSLWLSVGFPIRRTQTIMLFRPESVHYEKVSQRLAPVSAVNRRVTIQQVPRNLQKFLISPLKWQQQEPTFPIIWISGAFRLQHSGGWELQRSNVVADAAPATSDDTLAQLNHQAKVVRTNLIYITMKWRARAHNDTVALPGIKILGPGLQNIWETDDEVSQGYDGVCSDHRKSGALQHGKHEADVLFTRSWAEAKTARRGEHQC